MKIKAVALAVILSASIFQRSIAQPIPKGYESELDSAIPREGLQFYFEFDGSRFAEMSRAGNLLTMFSKTLSSSQSTLSNGKVTAFVIANANVLSTARVAFVGYEANQSALLIEGETEPDARQLKTSIEKLLADQNRALQVAVRGRTVVAGSSALAEKILNQSVQGSMAEDQDFAKAHARFWNDSLFGYIKLSAVSFSMPGVPPGARTVQSPAMLAALGDMPQAIAVGGSMRGDSANVKALIIGSSNGGRVGGIFSELLTGSSASLDEFRAAAFTPANTDVFVDVRVNWSKLFEAVQSLFATFTEAIVANTSESPSEIQASMKDWDFIAQFEKALGFSIKRDLLPTLGSEIAFCFTNSSAEPPTQTNGQRTPAKPSRHFMLMLSVKEPLKFEKLLVKILNGPKGDHLVFTQSVYRGLTIKSTKDVAYAIANGFLLAAGSAGQIRRALDAHAGDSLSTVAEFQNTFALSKRATLQAYFSPRMSRELVGSIAKDAKKADPNAAETSTIDATSMPMPIGLSFVPDQDGMLIEAALPSSVLSSLLAEVFKPKAGYGISPNGGVRSGKQATPTMTDDDLRLRRRP